MGWRLDSKARLTRCSRKGFGTHTAPRSLAWCELYPPQRVQKATTSVLPPTFATTMACMSAAWEADFTTAGTSPQGERALLSRLRHVRRQHWHLKP